MAKRRLRPYPNVETLKLMTSEQLESLTTTLCSGFRHRKGLDTHIANHWIRAANSRFRSDHIYGVDFSNRSFRVPSNRITLSALPINNITTTAGSLVHREVEYVRQRMRETCPGVVMDFTGSQLDVLTGDKYNAAFIRAILYYIVTGMIDRV